MTMTARRRLVAAAAAVALALALAACAGDDDPPGGTSTAAGAASSVASAHNAADAEFAQMMIVHHEGAIEMAGLAVDRGSSAEVRALGERIAAAQGPEIEQMTGCLEAWGESAPHEMGHGGMGHDGMDMDGMDQAGAMAELESLSGVAFDRRFLELMVAHHRGAVEMSERQIADGENAEAVALARTIVDAQDAEIAEMTHLLADL